MDELPEYGISSVMTNLTLADTSLSLATNTHFDLFIDTPLVSSSSNEGRPWTPALLRFKDAVNQQLNTNFDCIKIVSFSPSHPFTLPDFGRFANMDKIALFGKDVVIKTRRPDSGYRTEYKLKEGEIILIEEHFWEYYEIMAECPQDLAHAGVQLLVLFAASLQLQHTSELIQRADNVHALLRDCEPHLESSKTRSQYCGDSAESMKRCSEILKKIQDNEFEINIAFLSTKPSVGKSFIINALSTNIIGVPAKSSGKLEGKGVTSIPTRYRYGETRQYIRHYLTQTQITERKSFCREYYENLTGEYNLGPVKVDFTPDLSGNTETFFSEVKDMQDTTSENEQFHILYDEVIYPFTMMKDASMKYSLLDLPGYKDNIYEFRFCQLHACLKYCNVHTIAGITLGGCGYPEKTDLQLLLALGCFESNFTTNTHPPNYMNIINCLQKVDHNDDQLKKMIDELFLEIFGLTEIQDEVKSRGDIATMANRSLKALENRYSLYKDIVEHSMVHVFYKGDTNNLDHVRSWNYSVIRKLQLYIAETREQILCHQALGILAVLSVPLRSQVKTCHIPVQNMATKKEDFDKIWMLQRKGIEKKICGILELSIDECDETGDNGGSFTILCNLMTFLMMDITDALAKGIPSDCPKTSPQFREFLENHYLTEEWKAHLKNHILFGTPIDSSSPTSVLYIQNSINQLTDYVKREYRAWLDSDEVRDTSSKFLQAQGKEITEGCQRILYDFINQMKDLHPYYADTGLGEKAHQLSESLKDLQQYFRQKLKIKNSLNKTNLHDETIDIRTHALATPKRFYSRFSIPDLGDYKSLQECKRYVRIFKHNEFRKLVRRERQLIEVIPEILEPSEKWFSDLQQDIRQKTIVMTRNRIQKNVEIKYLSDSLSDDKLKPFREVPKDSQDFLKNIPPVFIPTYPRKSKLAQDSHLAETIPYIEYLETLRSLEIPLETIQRISFLVFEDDKEHRRLKQYHLKYGALPNVYFIVLEHSAFKLNGDMGIGRKRTFIQLAAEYFKFPFFAVIDDDVGRCEEFSPKHHQNIHDQYTTFRSLAFLRKLLLTEMFPISDKTDWTQLRNDLTFEISELTSSSDAALDAATVKTRKKDIIKVISRYVTNISEDGENQSIVAREMMQYILEDPLIASLATKEEPSNTLSCVLKKEFDILKYCDHIGTAALVNRSTNAYPPQYRRLQTFQNTTHIISSMIYQFVMYYTDAIKGLYHVDHDVFFNEEYLSHEDRDKLSKESRGPDDPSGQKLMTLGYKHEDKYHHRQLLLHGVTGFQVYWYNIESNKEETLVKGKAKPSSPSSNANENEHGQADCSQGNSLVNGNENNAQARKRKRNGSDGE